LSVVADQVLVESIRKALELGKRRRFKQSVDLIVVFRDFDTKGPEGRLREVVFLPRKPPKEARVCVVAEGDMALKAKEAGVPVYTRADLQEFRQDRKKAKKVAQQCDWVLVRVDLMGMAGASLGPVLGPRGKAPTPVPLNADIAQLIERYKSAVWVRVRGQPQVMCRVGTEDMRPEDIAENVKAVLSAIENRIGRQKIAKVIVKKTMGIPVEVPLAR
jgi:large subunit ribosomal protein L1